MATIVLVNILEDVLWLHILYHQHQDIFLTVVRKDYISKYLTLVQIFKQRRKVLEFNLQFKSPNIFCSI